LRTTREGGTPLTAKKGTCDIFLCGKRRLSGEKKTPTRKVVNIKHEGGGGKTSTTREEEKGYTDALKSFLHEGGNGRREVLSSSLPKGGRNLLH